MVRRGSTVRVRQRALQKRRTRGFSVQDDLLFVVRAVGMELFMELSRRDGDGLVVCEDNSAARLGLRFREHFTPEARLGGRATQTSGS
jgi:hypothetical protein